MKLSQILVLTGFVLIAPNVGQAQVAGSTLIGVAAAELRDVATGREPPSARFSALTSDKRPERADRRCRRHHHCARQGGSYAIINAGGFLHVTKHDVAVRFAARAGRREISVSGSDPGRAQRHSEFEYAQE